MQEYICERCNESPPPIYQIKLAGQIRTYRCLGCTINWFSARMSANRMTGTPLAILITQVRDNGE